MSEVVWDKTHEWNLFWLEFCRACPVLGRSWCFGVLGVWKLDNSCFLAWYNMLRLFQMVTKLGFNRCTSYVHFCKLACFLRIVELTKPKPVQASSRPAHSWYQFPDIHGVYLLQEIGFNAQDKQNDIKHALSK